VAGVIDKTVRQFSRLPGVGRRTAQRFVYHLLRGEPDQIQHLIDALTSLKEDVSPCSVCGKLTEVHPCEVCSDTRRDRSVICVVAESGDLDVVENSLKYRGLYHVLGGLLNPTGGVGPDSLRIDELIARVDEEVREIILALGAGLEGDTTAMYITRLLKSRGVRVTSLARGLPAGGSLDHADKITVGLSLEGRVDLEP
jgi:recombination protein RecR